MADPSERTGVNDFEERARAFLVSHAPRRAGRSAIEWGTGSDRVNLVEERSADQEAAELIAIRQWKALEFEHGFGWISGPSEYGGCGFPRALELEYRRIRSEFQTPSEGVLGVSLGMVAPTLLAHDQEQVRGAYLERLYRADLVGCQLFSEPGAGSDLAGVQTLAERDGDEWVVNGQKVWTSGAAISSVGELLCRTDPNAPRHAGLSAFVLDMNAPGVEVRPLRQMTGGSAFNEVFLTDVRIPNSHILGEINGGWSVAITTLMHERASIGGRGEAGSTGAGFKRVLQVVRHSDRIRDPLVRQALAEIYSTLAVARWTSRRQTDQARGRPLGSEASLGKLALVANQRRIAALIGALLGPRLVADTGEWGTYAWTEYILGAPGVRIAGGTDEIMRNVIGERVLGLPRD